MAELYVDIARKQTSERFEKVKTDLSRANDFVKEKACIYVTGSFGRLEASEYSDLDVFTVIDVIENEQGALQARLNGIEEIKHLMTWLMD